MIIIIFLNICYVNKQKFYVNHLIKLKITFAFSYGLFHIINVFLYLHIDKKKIFFFDKIKFIDKHTKFVD